MRTGIAAVCLVGSALCAPAFGQRIITTIAGTDYLFPGDGKPAQNAPLGEVKGVGLDAQGNLYIADQGNRMVMRVAPNGILRIYAGNGVPETGGDGGDARSAGLGFPVGLTIDASGNVYLLDSDRVRRITPQGVITTVAGGGNSTANGTPATSLLLDNPSGVAVAADGTLYVSDFTSARVYRIAGGVSRVYAGGGTTLGDGGPASSAQVDPAGLALDAAGNLYIADAEGGRVRRVTPQGVISTFAGGGDSEAERAIATEAALPRPTGVAVDRDGAVYIADASDNRVRKVAGGLISTVAGNGNSSYSGDGGSALQAAMNSSSTVAVDAAGNVYIGEERGRRVRRVDTGGIITTVAGNGLFRFSGDGGPAIAATLNNPDRVVVDANGNIYFQDVDNGRVRRIAPNGVVNTVAGGGASRADGIPATTAEVSAPIGLALDSAGNLYIGEATRIRRVDALGIISLVAGGGGSRGEDVPALQAELDLATAIAFDSVGNLYFAEVDSNRVRRIVGGRVSTFAGTGDKGSSGDGGQARQAQLSEPRGLAFDALGNLYIAEQAGHRVRRVRPDGLITLFAGAPLESPESLAFDTEGNLYIADSGNSLIRRVTPAGILSTVAGNGSYEFGGDGGPATSAALNGARGIAVDREGNLYIADNDRIRKVLVAAPGFRVTPASLAFAVQAGGIPPQDQTIRLLSDAPVAFTSSASEAWLTLDPRTGGVPATASVRVNPAGLAAGSYQGRITLSAPGATPASLTITVSLTVSAGTPAEPAVEPSSLQFSFTAGARVATRQMRVINRGGGSLGFTATARGTGLTVSPASGTATSAEAAVLTVTADASTLGSGTFRGEIVVETQSPARTISVPVTISAGRVQQTVLVSQTGLTFVAVQGGGTPPPQQAGILNLGQGVMSWSASASVFGGVPTWLSVTPASGASTAASLQVPPIDIAVTTAGLDQGEYYGQIRVDAPDADNSPQFISVVMNVLPAGQNPGPLVRPTGFIFVGEEGASPGSQDLFVSNLTATAATFITGRTPEPPAELFRVAPPQGNVVPGSPFRVVVQPSFRGLTRGVRQGTLTIDFSDGTFQTVRILMVVIPPVPAGEAPRTAASNCTPTSLRSEFTLVPKNFVATIGWPTPIEMRQVDDCGDALSAGAVVATFSSGDPPVALTHIQNGRWSGTWTPKLGAAGATIIRVTSTSADRSLRGEVTIDGSVRANPNPPVVSPGGIVSSASFLSYAPLAPGSLISIFGRGLADGTQAASGAPLPTRLQTTDVILQGRTMPLFFVSDSQINAVIPYDVSVDTQLPLVVRRGGRGTAVETVPIAAAQPAIFAVVNATGALVNGQSPARAGDTVVLYCEGLGAVNPPVAAGAAASSSQLSRVMAEVKVTIGGLTAEAPFAGLAPGFAGLYQVNVVVPTGVEPGDAVPVIVTAANQVSQAKSISVR